MSEPARYTWEVPPAVKRLAWWWCLPFVCLGAFVLAWVLLGFPPAIASGSSMLGALLNPLLLFTPIFATVAIARWRIVRMRRAYRASQGRLCTWCVHDLIGLDDTGVCPECGRPFDIEQDRAAWKRAGVE